MPCLQDRAMTADIRLWRRGLLVKFVTADDKFIIQIAPNAYISGKYWRIRHSPLQVLQSDPMIRKVVILNMNLKETYAKVSMVVAGCVLWVRFRCKECSGGDQIPEDHQIADRPEIQSGG
jgi:hypothetical protein